MRYSRRTLFPRGFTLVEVLVAVVIIGILAALALPFFQRSTDKARSLEAVTNLGAIRRAEHLYHMQHGTFVEALDLPTLKATLDVDLTDRYFDYEVTQADATEFLVVATGTRLPHAAEPLRVTMDHTGKLTYHWPQGPGGGSSSGGGAVGGGGGAGGIGGGSGGGGGGGGGGGTGGGGGGGGSGGDDTGGGRTGGGAPFVTVPVPVPGSTTPNIPDQTYADAMRGVVTQLQNEASGSRARELADFLILYQVQLVFTPTDALGFVFVTDRARFTSVRRWRLKAGPRWKSQP